MSIKKYLDGTWNLSFTNPDDEKLINTTIEVPSNIEPKLVELGLVDDFYPANTEYSMMKFESVDDWCYTTTFDAEAIDDNYKYQLVFEGIDTIAEVYLNDEKICDCCNMHMTYSLDVAKLLKKKNNKLKVIIRSSQLWAREHIHDMFSTSHENMSYYDSQAYLRKARHQWGWDNAPRLITSGIFRSVYLEKLPLKRFEEVYLFTASVDDDYVKLGANWVYTTDKKNLLNHNIKLSLIDGDKVVFESTCRVLFVQGHIIYKVPRSDVKLWWPTGFGDPNLYTVKLEMFDGDELTATYESSFGIRTLLLEHTPYITADGDGEFVFKVNGEKVFIRGTNWKPLDALASIADKKTREGSALQELVNLNCNMVRIWGGGIYEDEYFFEFCDKNGIMVWQDFMFACEIPPTDEDYCKLVKEEAIQIVKKLRNHPSLATWCGDNENDEIISETCYESQLRPSDSYITRRVLKDAVLHHDSYRTYVDSSPFVADENYVERATEIKHFQTERHLYPATINYAKALRDCKSLFIGETGPIGINSITVNDAIYDREKERAERLWNVRGLQNSRGHQCDGYFCEWRAVGEQMCKHCFGRDFSFAEWKDYTLAVNIICAEVFKDVIEYSRVTRWSKTGVLWWSLADMWPMLFNYSVLDSDLHKKLGYHWIRQSQQEFAIMACREEVDGELCIYAANDTLETVEAEYTITAYDENCVAKDIAFGTCKQDKNSTTLIQRVAEGDAPQLWVIKWKKDGNTYMNHVFTKIASYDVMRSWVKIIGEAGEFADEILELK